MRWRVVVPLAVALAVGAGVSFVALDRHSPATHPLTAVTPSPQRSPLLTALQASAPPLTTQAVAAALGPALRTMPAGEQVGGLVIDPATGTTLWSRHPATAVAPASTLKLLTAAVALHSLGPDYAFRTTTRLVGNTIYLVGGGDPTIVESTSTKAVPTAYPTLATLADLARQTAAELQPPAQSFRLRVDASLWSGPTLAKGWSADYVTEGDVTRPSSLELDGGRLRPAELDSPRTADPAGQAAAAFAALLRTDGVTVRGPVASATTPATATELAQVSSPPLAALVQRMLTDSDNDLAEAMGRAIAIHENLPATFAGEVAALNKELTAIGVPTDGLSLQDASGLSHDDAVAPVTLVGVLRAATNDPALRPVLEGLPVAGFTGTLSDRYRGKHKSAGTGYVRAKTGSLTGVNTLAGLAVDAAGRMVVFALLGSGTTQTAAVQTSLDAAASGLAAAS